MSDVEERDEKILKEANVKRKTLIKAIVSAVALIVVATIVFVCIYNPIIVPAQKYKEALGFIENGEKMSAVKILTEISEFKDSREKCFLIWNDMTFRETVSTGTYHTVALKDDGTVVAVGKKTDGQCDVDGWTDIVAVSAGTDHTVGLKSDGTVIAGGENSCGQCNVKEWTDIVAISAGGLNTVGLKSDGTVVVAGFMEGECQGFLNWTDIIAVSAGDEHIVGLKADGTVVAEVASGFLMDDYGQGNVSGWTDIIAVSAGKNHTVGLKSDGTVVAVGDDRLRRCDVRGWSDIIAVSAGYDHTLGLKADGTVVVAHLTGDEGNVEDFDNIVGISAGFLNSVVIMSDGSVASVGYNKYGQSNVTSFGKIKLPQQ